MRIHEAGALHADEGLPAGLPPPGDPAAIDPHVWPTGLRRDAGGALRLREVDLRAVAHDAGTPCYLVDEVDFRSRARAFAAAFGGTNVHYAAKAFCVVELLRWVREEGLSLDVCTAGELAVAQRAAFPPELIGMHGNNKSPDELAAAVEAGVGRVIVDSFIEIDRLASAAEAAGRRQQVLVRATVGVEAHTHEFIATAHEDQKFGFSLAGGDALAAARQVVKPPSLELVGIHSHIGSQIFDTDGFEVAARRAVGLLASIRDELGLVLPVLDLGGGFGIAYRSEDDPVDAARLARDLTAQVSGACAAVDLPMPQLIVEPGRAIAGPSTLTLYRIGTVKPVEGRRSYVSVDGGMSDNIRTALYGATYTCTLANRVSDAPPMLARVVGKHCESGDIVVRDSWLPADTAPGDLLAVAATGAYCRSLANTYNHVPRPPVLAVRDGVARTIVRRETIDDLLRLDVV